MTTIPEDCIFYHSIDLPGLGTVPGVWDHRGTADAYLGHVDVAGKSVLEVGPASGFFSFELERRGARVTALELGEESDWDRVPTPYMDDRALQAAMRDNVAAVHRSWSFAHARLGSKVATVWGTAYEAPRLVDAVDVAMFGNVLQHLRDPLLALSRVAQVTRETLIVSETLWIDTPEFRETALMQLIPRADLPEVCGSWFNVSPAVVTATLQMLGFPRIRCEFHHQRFNGDGSTRSDARMVPHFTVVGRRMAAGSADPAVALVFGDDWHGLEPRGARSLRWSKDRRAVIRLRAERATRVDVAFGVKGAVRGVQVTAKLGGEVRWRGATLDVCGVALQDVPLPKGDSLLELEMDGPPDTTLSATRSLGMMLFDFGVAPAC
ncbi:MAG: hypothetical protein ABW221_22290 [Vicinamibacteria bacterium]